MTDAERTLHAAARGAVAAMAMTGMRVWTQHVGLLDQTPPEAVATQRRVRGWLRRVPRERRRATLELVHWTYGAAGGAAFGVLPDEMRRARWSGPAYGIVLWLGFEFGLAPLLGLSQSRRLRVVERAVLATDHLLYGLVLSEGHARPRE